MTAEASSATAQRVTVRRAAPPITGWAAIVAGLRRRWPPNWPVTAGGYRLSTL